MNEVWGEGAVRYHVNRQCRILFPDIFTTVSKEVTGDLETNSLWRETFIRYLSRDFVLVGIHENITDFVNTLLLLLNLPTAELLHENLTSGGRALSIFNSG